MFILDSLEARSRLPISDSLGVTAEAVRAKIDFKNRRFASG